MSQIDLPAGLTHRPLERADAPAVFTVMAEQEQADLGAVEIELADIEGDWARPSFDVAAATIGVFDGDRLVGYAECTGGDRGDAAVTPDHRGRGIGTALSGWMRTRAGELGAEVIGMPVPEGSAGERLMRELGYRERWRSWVLELPEGAAIATAPLPAGWSLRPADGEAELRAAWTVLEDAFLEWSVREREPFEDFLARTTGRPDFLGWNLRLLLDPDGQAVGVSVVHLSGDGCGYIDRIAVRADQRGNGFARALLADSFAVARSHGARRCELSTDSRTGALTLYERVGMRVRSTWVNLAAGTTGPR